MNYCPSCKNDILFLFIKLVFIHYQADLLLQVHNSSFWEQMQQKDNLGLQPIRKNETGDDTSF